MSFFTSRNNMRSAQPNRRLVPPPPMRRPMPRPQMSRPIQPVRPPTGLPQQISAPTGLPNQMRPPLGMPNEMLPPIGLPNINQPPIGLPNVNQQPTGLPPTQTQLPTPPTTLPVEQSNSMFAPPQQAMPIQQPAIAPVFQPPPQMAQPIQQQSSPFANEPGRDSNGVLIPGYGEPPPGTSLSQPVDRPNIYGNLTPGEALGGEFTSGKYRPQQNQRDPQYAGMPDDMYGRMIADHQRQQAFAQQNPGMPQMRSGVILDYEQFMNDQREQNQVAGPIAPGSIMS